MSLNFKILLQYIAPQHLLSRLAGWIAESHCSFIKNILIKSFIKIYKVDLSIAVLEDANSYPSFNSFFIRHLKPELRPIVQEPNQIACPVDGIISQVGKIEENQLLQAKGYYYSVNDLLGSSDKANLFLNGDFATFYLAPHDYHRVHMPLSGKLLETIYIPGKLFSVNQTTARSVSSLFTRNERLVCFFETEKFPIAIVLVGAMIVGAIRTSWKKENGVVSLQRGDEMGYFKLGSTVIVLFPKNNITWSADIKEQSKVCMGQLLGTAL